MFGAASSRRNAIALSLGWWYLRRLIRKRGTAAVAGFVAGEGLSFARRPRKRHSFRWLLLLGAVGVAILWRRRQQGGGDDWGDWKPSAPTAPLPAEPAPEPVSAPVAT